MKERMKKCLSVVVAFCMVFLMMPMNVSADGEGSGGTTTGPSDVIGTDGYVAGASLATFEAGKDYTLDGTTTYLCDGTTDWKKIIKAKCVSVNAGEKTATLQTYGVTLGRYGNGGTNTDYTENCLLTKDDIHEYKGYLGDSNSSDDSKIDTNTIGDYFGEWKTKGIVKNIRLAKYETSTKKFDPDGVETTLRQAADRGGPYRDCWLASPIGYYLSSESQYDGQQGNSSSPFAFVIAPCFELSTDQAYDLGNGVISCSQNFTASTAISVTPTGGNYLEGESSHSLADLFSVTYTDGNNIGRSASYTVTADKGTISGTTYTAPSVEKVTKVTFTLNNQKIGATATVTYLIVPVGSGIVNGGDLNDKISWTLDNEGTLTISGLGDMPNYEMENSSPFRNNSNIKKVVIDDGITSIGDDAFGSCDNLASISIPSSVTSIGNNAFGDCVSLAGIMIPDSVTSIGDNAFSRCGFQSVKIPSGVTSLGHGIFAGCSSLSNVDLPETLTSIGDHAFFYCSFVNIWIPKSVKSIEAYAFDNCSSLTNVYYEGSEENWNNTSIINIATDGNSCLTNATKHYNASKDEAASGTVTGNLSDTISYTISSDGTLTISGSGAIPDYGDNESGPTTPFYKYRSIKKVIIDSGITSIGEKTFASCDNIASVEIASSVNSIGVNAFRYCTNLTTINIPDTVTSIGFCAFCGCSKLQSVNIPSGVTSIESSIFESCTSLTSIGIPKSVTSIGGYAFSECSALSNVYYEGSEAEWTSLMAVIGANNDSLKNATNKHFGSVSVTLNKTALNLKPGESETLTVTVKPDDATDKAVTWTSSDTNVATIDENGKVTATGVGTATITVTPKSTGIPATCEVTVNPTVKFDADNGSAVTAQTIEYGAVVTEPAAPTKTGYIFSNWQLEGKDYDFASPVTSDITLKAKWTANKYTVKFDANGAAKGTMADESFTYDKEQALTANAYAQEYTVQFESNGGSESFNSLKSTWNFDKWTTDTEGNGSSYTDGQTVTNLTSTKDGTVELIAQWTKPAVTLPIPTRTGYTFEGWYTDKTGGTLVGKAGESYTPSSNITLYAQWTINSYTITRQYRLQNVDGTYGDYQQIDSKEYAYGSTVAAWSRAADDIYQAASIESFTVGAKDDTLSIDVDRNTATNTIQYRLQNADGTYGSEQEGWTGTLRAGESHTWNRKADSIYQEETKTITGTKDAQTLTVDVSRVSYTVKFDGNGGTNPDDVTKLAGNTLGTLPSSTRPGYTFDGWYTEKTGGTKITETEKVSDTTYYAHWSAPIEYKITYDLDDGTASNPATYTIESDDITLHNPTKEGYTFTGWTGSNGETPSKEVKIEKGTTGDLSYTAIWRKIKTYTVSSEDAAETNKKAVEAAKKAEDGDTIKVDMARATTTTISKDVLLNVQGKDVDVIADMGTYSWTINGKDISTTEAETEDIDLGLTKQDAIVPAEKVSKLAGDNPTEEFSLSHDGAFGFDTTLSFDVGVKRSGQYANLFWYKDDGTFEYITRNIVTTDGWAIFHLTHASDYVVVFADKALGEETAVKANTASEAASDNGNSENNSNPVTTADSGNSGSGTAGSTSGTTGSGVAVSTKSQKKKSPKTGERFSLFDIF